MFTKDQLSALLHANGKEGIMATVNQIPEDELRNALVLAVTMRKRSQNLSGVCSVSSSYSLITPPT